MEISFQLYSARGFTPWPSVFKTLSDLGYAQVEGFGDLYADPKSTRALLERHGLAMPSGHFSLDLLEQDPGQVVSVAKELGITRVFCPFLDAAERPRDRAGWDALGQRLSKIGQVLDADGLRFGWHNHDFEFERLEDGSLPMEALLNAAPGISWEADIAWIAQGGADPFEWINRFGSRISVAHIKDIAEPGANLDEDGWADVGHGILDWKALWAALAETPCDLFVVEHDNPADLDRFARRSIAQIKQF